MDSISVKSIILSALLLIAAFALIKIIIIIIRNVIGLRINRVVNLEKNGESIQIPIKPCPFCGRNVSEIFESEDEDGKDKLYSIVCDIHGGGCGCSTGAYPKPIDALKAWNMRLYSDDE